MVEMFMMVQKLVKANYTKNRVRSSTMSKISFNLKKIIIDVKHDNYSIKTSPAMIKRIECWHCRMPKYGIHSKCHEHLLYLMMFAQIHDLNRDFGVLFFCIAHENTEETHRESEKDERSLVSNVVHALLLCVILPLLLLLHAFSYLYI